MALSRKMLAAMDIPAEKIDEIIQAHTETVTALKEQIDTLKADANKLPDVEAKLKDAETKLKEADSAGWEKKYTDLKSEYDGFKSDIETKKAKDAKETAYRKLLTDAGISEKRIAAVMKVSGPTLESLKLNEDGTVQDAEKLSENVKKEWADFIVTEQVKGANPPTPPANNGGDIKQPSRAKELTAQYHAEHYGNSTKEE